MNKSKILTILAVGLLAGPMAANAVPVQSSTSVFVTFRDCIAGATVCDNITPVQFGGPVGNPGATSASSSQTNAAYGSVNGSVSLSGTLGAPILSTHASSIAGTLDNPGTRNSTNSFALQRFTYNGAVAESRTFGGTLGYDQTIPDPFGTFPNPNGTSSGVSAYLEVFQISDAFLEAGTTAQDNFNLLFGGYATAAGYVDLGNQLFNDNATNLAGAASLSVTVTLQPGQSYWVIAWLQTPAANGAEVNAYRFATEWDDSEDLTTRVPEPGTLALLGLGLAGLGFGRRKRNA